MTLQASDQAVLDYLLEQGPGLVAVRDIAAATSLKRVVAEAILMTLACDGLIRLAEPAYDFGAKRYVVWPAQ